MQNISEDNNIHFKDLDEMLIKEIYNTVLSIDDVIDFSSSIVDNFQINILKIDPINKGIKLSHNNDELILDVFIIVKFGVNIPQLAWEIQGKIKDRIKILSNQPIKAININVNGVRFPKEEIIND